MTCRLRIASGALAAACAIAWLPGCAPRESAPERKVSHFSAASLDGVITRDGVSVDSVHSTDGDGSLRVEVAGPTTVRLYEVADPGVEDAMLFYRARLRSDDLEGRAYLEMWARVPGQGEFFSRGLDSAISGDTEWTSQETPFVLQAGQRPDLVKLNLVIEGAGTVWIDEIELAEASRG
jgi:hypothetical protein